MYDIMCISVYNNPTMDTISIQNSSQLNTLPSIYMRAQYYNITNI